MLLFSDSVKELLDNSENILVFPSEVAAIHWRRNALQLISSRFLRSDRIISWDSFKERTFALHRKEVPANSLTRFVFASNFLEENARESPLLQHFITPEYAKHSNRFTEFLVSILPRLKRANNEVGSRRLNPGAQAKGDLTRLFDSYTRFLVDQGLYEPAYEEPEDLEVQGAFVVLFPEVIEDYPEFAALLKKAGVETFMTPRSSGALIQQFDNSRLELTWLFQRISELLSSGSDFQDILITSCDHERWEGRLREAALRYDIPLEYRYGRNLASYRESRLFSLLSGCVETDFSLKSVEALLLDRIIPWRDSGLASRTFRLGLTHRCVRGRTLWLQRLGRSGDREAHDFFRSLTSQMDLVTRAGSFTELRTRIQAYISRFLDLELLSDASLRVVQSCLNLLNHLAGLEENAGLSVSNPFSLWLGILKNQLYVQRSSGLAIPVYPYRVSAGVFPKFHFVLNASERATSVRASVFPFLPDHLTSHSPDFMRDFSSQFFNLYRESGEEVCMSFSRQSFDGPMLPPSTAVTEGLLREATTTKSDEFEEDPYNQEISYWSGTNPAISIITVPQLEGFHQSLETIWEPKPVDLTIQTLDISELNESLLAQKRDEDDVLGISSTALDLYTECGFSYLMTVLLDINEEEFELSLEDARAVGLFQHDVLYQLYSWIRDHFGRFRRESLDWITSLVPSIVDEVLSRPKYRDLAFIPPVLASLKERVSYELYNLLEVEAKELGDYRIVDLEERYEIPIQDSDFKLIGRIDRVSEADGKYVLIDYKKRYRFTAADLNGEAEGYATFQLPFYLELVEQKYPGEWRAAYFDVTKAELKTIINEGEGGSLLDSGQTALYRETQRKALSYMAEGLRSGRYLSPSRVRGCDSCRVRSVCRQKFVVK